VNLTQAGKAEKNLSNNEH